MHAFQPESFAVLSPAKAKAAALALFDSAMLEPAADWRGVAFALHSVVTRKRGAGAGPVNDEIAMGDAADAAEYVAWADYSATGKAANIARGRVTVTFADGWSKTVGMLAGNTTKGRKPWSIAAAVRFAVVCYKIAAVRRATGSDAALYFDKGGLCAGETVVLDKIVSAPDILSIVSADSAETVAGDLVWNPCEANAATIDHRAGVIAVPADAAEGDETLAAAIRAERERLTAELRLRSHPVRSLHIAACARVEALLPGRYDDGGRASWGTKDACRDVFSPIMDAAPDAYPPEDFEAIYSRGYAAAVQSAGGAVRYGADPDRDPYLSGHCLSREDRTALALGAFLAWPPEDEIADAPNGGAEAVTSEHADTGEPPAPSGETGVDDGGAEPAQEAEKPLYRAPVFHDKRGGFTAYRDGRSAPMEEVFPDHVVLIGGSHRARAGCGDGLVLRLPYPQTGCLITIADAVTGPGKGFRFSGPRPTMKRLRAETARFEACQEAAEAIAPWSKRDDVDFGRERFLGRAHYHPHRQARMADALFAFGFEGDDSLPTGRLSPAPFAYRERLLAIMDCRAEACPHWHAIRQSDLEAIWPPMADDAEPQGSPLASVEPDAATHVDETPAAPARKPRYRYSHASGKWEVVEAVGKVTRLAA